MFEARVSLILGHGVVLICSYTRIVTRVYSFAAVDSNIFNLSNCSGVFVQNSLETLKLCTLY